jgi:transcriptional regulator with XRE-family HTH domain
VQPTMRDLGQFLRRKREKAGLTQSQVADELKVPRPAISLVENGVRHVSTLEYAKLARLYGFDMNEFFGRTGK